LKVQLQKQKDASAAHLDPGVSATLCATQAGLQATTLRVLMHAVVDHLRPEGPITYRICHREDARLLFVALDSLMSRADIVEWILWLLYLHLISRKKALDVAMTHIVPECTKTGAKTIVLFVQKKCSIVDTLWDTRRSTGGVVRALQVAENHSDL